MERKKKVLAAAAAALLLLAGGAALRHRLDGKAKDGEVRLSGNIEVTDVEASFRIAGRVLERLVDEGDRVSAGQVLARLDPSELEREAAARAAEAAAAAAALAELSAGPRRQEVGRAAAETARAKARYDELSAGSRPEEIEAARAAVSRARAEEERLRKDLERADYLFGRGVISRQQQEKATSDAAVAAARLSEATEGLRLVEAGPRAEQVAQARESYRQVKETESLVREGARKETIAQARARLRQAEELKALAATRLGYATLASPLSGTVLSKGVEPGDYVSPGTAVVTVGSLDDVYFRGYVEETSLGKVKVGQAVDVSSDTFPGKVYPGRIVFIAPEAEFTPKSVQTEKERVRLVFRVKVAVANPAGELKPGMPAVGLVRPSSPAPPAPSAP
jgi:HlyD family secretion protein